MSTTTAKPDTEHMKVETLDRSVEDVVTSLGSYRNKISRAELVRLSETISRDAATLTSYVMTNVIRHKP